MVEYSILKIKEREKRSQDKDLQKMTIKNKRYNKIAQQSTAQHKRSNNVN